MRISFDVDETLVCREAAVPVEASVLPGFIHRRFGEPLRRGTGALMQELRQRGWSIWIYTSSGRTAFQIRRWLWLYGLRVDGVINEERHRRELSSRPFARLPSKYPPAFGIDLHVDDSEGVRMEGEEHGFKVVIIRPHDGDWTRKVLDAANLAHAI